MTFEEWSKKKKEQQDLNQKQIDTTKKLNGNKLTFSEWSKKQRANEVDQNYIDTFVSDIDKYISGAEKKYGTIGWGNAATVANANKVQWDDLYTRASRISDYLDINKDLYDEKTYKEMTDMLTNYMYLGDEITSSFDNAYKEISQFKTEEEYNNQKLSYEINNMTSAQILEYMNKNGKNAVAVTTPDGKNYTWQYYYDKKKAQEDFEYNYGVYSKNADWGELSSGIGYWEEPGFSNKEATRSDYDIAYELVSTRIPYDKQTALANGISEQEYEDIAKKRKYIEQKYNVKLDVYDDVNVLNGIMDKLQDDPLERQSFEYMDYLTQEERSFLNYIYNTQGRSAALAWQNSIETTLQERAVQKTVDDFSVFAKEHPWLSSAASVGLNTMAAGQQLVDIFQYFGTGEVDPNLYATASSAIRGQVSNMVNWEIGNWDAFDFLYNTGMSMADSATSNFVFGSMGGAVQGLSAAAQATNDAINRGATKDKAFWSGILAGTFEGVFESISLGKFNALKETAVKSGYDVAKNIGKTMLVNASEEATTEIANIVADILMNSDLSQYETSVRNYMDQGMSESEARHKSAVDLALQVVEAGASGALMGLGFGAGGSLNQYINYNANAAQQGAQIKQFGGQDALKQLALDMYTNKNGLDAAIGVRRASKVASNPSSLNVGKLAIQMGETGKKANVADVQSALVDKGVSKNDAKRIANYVLGMETFSDKEATEIANKIKSNPEVKSVVDEMLNSPDSSLSERARNLLYAKLGLYSNTTTAKTTKKLTPHRTVETANKVSSTGKTTNTKTGEDITIDKNNAIAKVEMVDGERVVYYNTNQGVVKASDVKYANEDDVRLYESFDDLNPAFANAVIKNYDGSVDLDTYIKGMREGIIVYGMNNFQAVGKDINNASFLADLSAEDQAFALKLGREYAKVDADKAENNLRKAIEEAKKKAEQNEGKENAEKKTAPKGAVTFENGAKATTAEQKKAVFLAKHLASAMGINIVFYDARKGGGNVNNRNANGWYDEKTDTIHIDLQKATSDTKTITFTLSHELVHFIKKNSPAKFNTFANFLMEQYAAHDIDTSKMLAKKMSDLGTTDYNEAYEEMICDACETMLLDSNAMVKLMELRKQDLDLFETIKLHVMKVMNALREAYRKNGYEYTKEESKALLSMTDVIEEIYARFEDAAVTATQNYQDTSLLDMDENTDVIPVEAAVKHSYKSLANAAGFEARINDDGTRSFVRDGNAVSEVTVEDIEKSPIGAFINYSLDKNDISEEQATAQKEMFAQICTMACKTNDFSMAMQFVGSAVFTGMKANADKQYGTTYDFPSICTKTQAVIDAMSARMVKLGRGLESEEIVKIYQEVFASGNPVPCPECYVFSRWIGIGGLLDNIKKYQDYYGAMTVAEVSNAYKKMHSQVSAFAEEQNLTFGKAKGALTSKLTKEYNKLTEKIQKQENQGEKVSEADRKRLAEIEPMMNTVKAMTWIENVYFADSALTKVNPKFRVPNEVLFDLNNGEAFASLYKAAWAFRTTQGAGYGKAITPYAEANLGEGILVTNNTSNAIKGKAQGTLNNFFLQQNGQMDAKARKALDSARAKQKNQAFIGGQRFQSTSDARYENASDYLLAALEMQAMHGMVQVYTKVDGAVPAFEAWGFSSNQSLMPRGSGLDANGKVQDTSVGGMNPSVATENRKKHEHAGTITIGVNDNHIRALYQLENRDFIIPYHASGGKADVVAEFRTIQEGLEKKGEMVRSTDYSRTQSDKVLSDEVLEWLGKSKDEIEHIHKVREARIDILTRAKVDMDVVRGNRFLSALYDKLHGGEWDGVKLAKGKVASQIFPNEFWDQSVSYEDSAQITKDYLEYCEDLGFLHRFSGLVPSNGMLVPITGYNEKGDKVTLTDLAYKYDGDGNKTDVVEDFYWKTITDRRMYGNDGQYLPQQIVTLNDTTTDTVTSFARYNYGIQYDKAKSMATAQKVADESWGIKKQVKKIVGNSGKDYGTGVYLDSELLSNLTDDERVEMVKEYLKEIGGSVFTAYDSNGNAVDVHIVESHKKFKNARGKKVHVNQHLTNYLKNPIKQEAIALVDELILTARQEAIEPAHNPHDWLDNNGQNDWDVWTTYIQDKENTVWEATLQIANSTNGEKILYEIHPIEKVEGVEQIDTTSTKDMLPQKKLIVKRQMKNNFSSANRNIASYNGKAFWIAMANRKTGEIINTWTYEEAEKEGFDLERYVDAAEEDGYVFFTTELLQENGRIEYDDYGDRMPEKLIEKINSQITILAPDEEIPLRERIKDLHDRIGNLNKRLSYVVQWIDGSRELLQQRADNKITYDEYNKRLREDRYYRQLDDERNALEKDMNALIKELESQEGKPWKTMKNEVLYSTVRHQMKTPSNRTILSNALLETIDTSTQKGQNELKVLKDYQQKIAMLDEYTERLAAVKAEIAEISFNSGTDRSKLSALNDEKIKLTNRIAIADRQLVRIEAMKPIQDILEREKEKSYKKAAEYGREILRRKAERQDTTVLRGKLKNTIKKLSSLMQHETKEKNVKSDMKGTIDYSLQLANVLMNDTISNEDIVRLGVESVTDQEATLLNEYRTLLDEKTALREKINETYANENVQEDLLDVIHDYENKLKNVNAKIAKLNNELRELFARERARLNRSTINSILDNLITEYSQLKTSENDYIKNAHSDAMEVRLNALKKALDGTVVADMTYLQLYELYDTFRSIEHMIRTSNKLFREGQMEDLGETVDSVQTEMYKNYKENKKDRLEATEKVADVIKSFAWNELKPIYAFDKIGSETLTKLYWDAVSAEGKYAVIVDDAKNFVTNLRQKHNFAKWDLDKIVKEYKTPNGNVLKLTLEDMMSIYAYSKREQAYKHMTKGGFVFDKNNSYKKSAAGFKRRRASLTSTFVVTDTILNDIVSFFNEKENADQKAYVDAMQEYMTKMGEKGNEVSRVLFGIDLFKEKVYMPLQSSADYLNANAQALSKTPTQVSLKNTGMTKPTDPNAQNPIVLQGFDEVWFSHIDKMAKYASFVLPIENLQRVFNNVSNVNGTDYISTQKLIDTIYGTAARDYVDQYITDLNGGAIDNSGYQSPFSAMFALSKKTSVLGNLSVWVQQYFAIIRAMDMVRIDFFLPFLRKQDRTGGLSLYQEMRKYAPITIIKEIGGFDVGSSRTSRDFMDNNRRGIKGKMKILEEIAGFGANLNDKLGWMTIWSAVKKEVATKQKVNPGTAEFYEACNKRFTEVIAYTQVYDSVNSRSGMMRSKKEFTKAATSFMGEPTVTVNMIDKSFTELVKSVGTKNAKSVAKAAARLGKTLTFATVSITISALFKSMIAANRDEDEDEAWLEKWMQHFGSNLVSDLNPLGMIPYLRDIVSVWEGWNIDRPDMDLIAEVVSSVKKATTDGVTLEEGLKLGGAISNAFGVPARNVVRDITGIVNFFKAIFDDVYPTDIGGHFIEGVTGKKRPKTDVLYESLIRGDDGRIAVIRGTYKTDSAYQTAVRQALRDNDPRIAEAAQAQLDEDYDRYGDLIDEIVGEGIFDEDDVQAAVKAEYNELTKDDEKESATESKEKSKYTAEFVVNAYVSGRTTTAEQMREDIINTAVSNGSKYDDAVSAFNTSFRSSVGEQYRNGDINRSTATNLLVKYGGYDKDKAENEAYWKLKEWDYKIANGDDAEYSRFGDFYTSVQTGKNIKNVIKEYTTHGYDKSDLASQITKYYKPLYKEMSTAERAKIKGYLLNAYVLLGYDRTKKNNDINKWLKD